MSKPLPVIWGSNPIHLYVFGNEFGATHVVIAENDSEAWEEWAETQEPCDHGNDPEVLAKIASEDFDGDHGCDCSLREDGQYVWDVYCWMRSHGRLEHFLGMVLRDTVPVR